MIYGMLMTGGTIILMPRIVPNHSRTRFLTSYRSRLGSKRLRANADSRACGLIGYPPGRFDKSEKPHPSWLLEFDPVFVSFLSTCSQIYHEAHLLPYTSNNFRVDASTCPFSWNHALCRSFKLCAPSLCRPRCTRKHRTALWVSRYEP